MIIHRTLTCASVVTALALSAGCIDTTDGELGNLSFQDETSGLEDGLDRRLNRPVAVGSTLPVAARCDDGLAADLIAATSADEAIATARIQRDTSGESLVLVDALAAGTVTIDVQSRCGDDRFTVTTADAADAELRWVPFASIFAPPDTLWADGVALLPDAPIDVRARRFDDTGAEMTGYGGLQWAVSSDTADLAAVTSRTDERMGDAITLRSGDAPGSGTLDAGLGEPLAFDVVTLDDVARLGLADIEAETIVEAGGALALPAGRELYILHLAAWTDEGAWIAGPGDPITMTVREGDPALLTSWDGSSLLENEDDQAELARILQNGRAIVWTTGDPGDVTVELGWGDHTATFDISIVDPDASDENESGGDPDTGVDGSPPDAE